MVTLGLESFLKKDYKRFKKNRLGVLCHQASNTKALIHASDALIDKRLGLEISTFFGPQHGIRGEKQDNMIESQDSLHSAGIPIVSLYSDTREPRKEHFSKIDVLLVDLQDIGCRVYTYMYTLANCMRVAKRDGKKIVVLDRPNPLGGTQVEGNVLDPHFASFVGQYEIASRHGMTLGELALLFNRAFGIECDLEVITVKGWKRQWYWDEWANYWVIPSPNIPTVEAAIIFPGSVLFEGTNISEGRGTTKPFEWIGAPFVDGDKLSSLMNKKRLPGVYFRSIYFQPNFQKHSGQICGGVQIHVLDRKRFKPARTGWELLSAIAETYPAGFQWKNPPYEYEYEKMPIDLIAGTDSLRKGIDNKQGLKEFLGAAATHLKKFEKKRKDYLLYG